MGVPAREVFNGVTHFVGAALSLVGLVFLVLLAEGVVAVTTVSIYGASLVVLYLSSALYHILPVRAGVKRVLRRIDKTAIYLLIAGTYTPVTMLLFPNALGYTVLAVVWGVALLGAVLRWVLPGRIEPVHQALYLGLGWLAVVGANHLLAAVPLSGLAWLVGGGLMYSVGAAVLGLGWPDPWPEVVGHHGVWHLMVVGGSVMHFVFVAGYVL